MSGNDPNEPVFSIGVVQKMTGLSGRQIRYYESAGLLQPYRTKGNQRLYSPKDVERLQKIKALLEQGHNVEGVRTQLDKAQADNSRPINPVVRPSEVELIGQKLRGEKLSSLFPVNNQAELSKFLQERQKRQLK